MIEFGTLIDLLEVEMEGAETSVLDDPGYPDSIRDGDLYVAVKDIEQHYRGKRLPLPARPAWQEMLSYEAGDDDSVEQRRAFYRDCETLLEWAIGERARLNGSDSEHKAGLQSDQPEDGPIDPFSFIWRGELYGEIRPKPYDLLCLLWVPKTHCADYDELGEIWGDCEITLSDGRVRAASRYLRQFFEKHAIGLTVKTQARKVFLLSEDNL